MILFELNTRVHGKPFDEIDEGQLRVLADLGFDWIWTMGIWRISPTVLEISRRYAHDFEGSPYAIADYEVSPELGGEPAFRRFVERAHRAGLRVMADFVPNHIAIDSPLIDAHPEWIIRSNPRHREQHPDDYFNHPKGRFAHGKDPFFPGWVDTAQLDYAHPELRAHMVQVVRRLGGLVDGLRCDMAMLVLREQVKSQWWPNISSELFDRHFPGEFWPIAIETARAERSDFVFMAEVYWDKETYLQELGFDYTYNKKLYDILAHHPSAGEIARYFASTAPAFLQRSVHFLENHDEERAAERFGARTRPAAVLSYAIPGVVFVHQGQMEGFHEKLPVQRVRPLRREEPDEDLLDFYERLLATVRDPLFREGEMLSLGGQHGAVLWARRYGGRIAIGAADVSRAPSASSPAIHLSAAFLGIGAGGSSVRAKDLWTGKPVVIDVSGDRLLLAPGAVDSYSENGAFLIELSV
ncbi:MAG TPA: alpha-amylase family glycosyl hydrolase [Polyangiaceae bacterium]|nr:alpha-amylase family glycosyl hydrolase [Polyangiaceae bacterium]